MLRIGALKAGGIGLALLCGSMVFVGCGGDDGDDGRSGGAGGQGGSNAGAGGTAGTGTAGTGTAGTGTAGTGTAGTAGTGGAATSACAAPVTPTTAGIIDYESGPQDTGPTLGTYVYGDTGGTITPTDTTVATGVMAPGADGTANGFHFTGTGFAAASYGGGLGIWLNCRDASGATGITFWYQSDVDLKVTLEMPSNKPIDPDMGECAGDYATCVQPSVTIPATAADTWEQATVNFTAAMGGMPTATFDPTKLVGIGIGVVKPAAAADGWGWDISIDEVEFVGLPGGNGTGGAPGAGGGGGEGGTPTP